jgi:cytoskeletal protein CcmA (bactofilin family)
MSRLMPKETIDDDLYVSGGTVSVRGTVNGNVFAAGNSVSVEGSVTGDVWAAGNTVSVAGGSANVRAAGNSVTFTGRSRGDVLLAGNNITFASGAAAGRDTAVAGNTVLLAGSVGRDLYSSASNLDITGSVGRNVRSQGDKLTIASGASVAGEVRYSGEREAQVSPGAVNGRVVRESRPGPREPSLAERVLWGLVGWARRVIGLFLFGIVFILLLPALARGSAERIAEAPLPSAGTGFVLLVVVPVVALMVFLFGLVVGGWWIALMLLALYWIAVALATVVTALFVGRWLLARFGQTRVADVAALLLGIVLLTALEAVPVLGVLVRLAEVVVGLGALVLASYRAAPARPAPAEPAPVAPAT